MRRTRLIRPRLALAGATALALLPSVGAHADAAFQYTIYPVGMSGGEPSIGYDNVHKEAVFGAGTSIRKLTWDDSVTPPAFTATALPKPATDVTTLDAITTVDAPTGRIFNSQLAGVCSLMSFSDDGGSTWTPSQGCGENTLLDHQSVGVGPFPAPLAGSNPVYSDAVYYCAQNGFNGACSVSLDGGLTFGQGVYAYNTPANDPEDTDKTIAAEGGACSALHGHLKVGPDGTAYLPVKGCGGSPSIENGTNTEYVGGRPALSTSNNLGATWTVHIVPGSNVPDGLGGSNPVGNPDESDSSVSVSRGGVVYYTWENGTNPSDIENTDHRQAMVAWSKDDGATWSAPVDLSSRLGLHNVMFPVVVAGDDDRAAVAFLGTTAIGDTQTNHFPNEVWDLYVAMTYDGGATWETHDVAPDDPVQRGCIDMQGTTIPPSDRQDVCTQRNLLDFNDITLDNQGRPIVAYSDGCEAACQTDATKPSRTNVDKVARLSSGRGLYAQYDGVLLGSGPGVAVPEVPLLPLIPLAGAAALGVRSRLRARRGAGSH
jgi:hypothetical protein